MTAFYFVVATLPLALYWLALAGLHVGARPRVVSGRRDCLALALATSGLFFIGPGQIAPTLSSLMTWGYGVWGWLAALYFLAALFVALKRTPCYVVYNTTQDALRKTLTKAALQLDDEARWSGVSMNLPGLGVQFYLDDSPLGRTTTLIRIGRDQSSNGWRRLGQALDAELKAAPPASRSWRSTRWLFFALLGGSLLVADYLCFARYFDEICDAAMTFFRI